MNFEKWIYQVRNWKAQFRALIIGSLVVADGLAAKLFGSETVIFQGTVSAVITRANPKWYQRKVLDLGIVGRRVVTTAFVNYLRDDLANASGGADVSTFKYHECGTGTNAEAITDTALQTPCTTALNPDSTRAVGTQDNATAKTYKSVGTLTFDAAGPTAVTEHGLFNAATTGVLMDRTVFAAMNVYAADSIQFTYSLTISDGG
jgi:hypothetical protein